MESIKFDKFVEKVPIAVDITQEFQDIPILNLNITNLNTEKKITFNEAKKEIFTQLNTGAKKWFLINGRYGNGKSAFLKLLKDEAKLRGYYIISIGMREIVKKLININDNNKLFNISYFFPVLFELIFQSTSNSLDLNDKEKSIILGKIKDFSIEKALKKFIKRINKTSSKFLILMDEFDLIYHFIRNNLNPDETSELWLDFLEGFKELIEKLENFRFVWAYSQKMKTALLKSVGLFKDDYLLDSVNTLETFTSMIFLTKNMTIFEWLKKLKYIKKLKNEPWTVRRIRNFLIYFKPVFNKDIKEVCELGKPLERHICQKNSTWFKNYLNKKIVLLSYKVDSIEDETKEKVYRKAQSLTSTKTSGKNDLQLMIDFIRQLLLESNRIQIEIDDYKRLKIILERNERYNNIPSSIFDIIDEAKCEIALKNEFWEKFEILKTFLKNQRGR